MLSDNNLRVRAVAENGLKQASGSNHTGPEIQNVVSNAVGERWHGQGHADVGNVVLGLAILVETPEGGTEGGGGEGIQAGEQDGKGSDWCHLGGIIDSASATTNNKTGTGDMFWTMEKTDEEEAGNKSSSGF